MGQRGKRGSLLVCINTDKHTHMHEHIPVVQLVHPLDRSTIQNEISAHTLTCTLGLLTSHNHIQIVYSHNLSMLVSLLCNILIISEAACGCVSWIAILVNTHTNCFSNTRAHTQAGLSLKTTATRSWSWFSPPPLYWPFPSPLRFPHRNKTSSNPALLNPRGIHTATPGSKTSFSSQQKTWLTTLQGPRLRGQRGRPLLMLMPPVHDQDKQM